MKLRARCYHNKRCCKNCPSLYRCIYLAIRKTPKVKMNRNGIFLLSTKLNSKKTCRGRIRRRWIKAL